MWTLHAANGQINSDTLSISLGGLFLGCHGTPEHSFEKYIKFPTQMIKS
jgi:hypothetical protein